MSNLEISVDTSDRQGPEDQLNVGAGAELTQVPRYH